MEQSVGYMNLFIRSLFLLTLISLFQGCIGDDIIDDRVPEEIRITTVIDTMAVGESFQFEAKYFNEIGENEAISVSWSSSNEEVISISNQGLALGLKEGVSTIKASYSNVMGVEISDQFSVVVTDQGGTTDDTDSRPGIIKTTSSYLLEGSFSLNKNGTGLTLVLNEDFKATTALPGLYVYLGNNKSSISSALEISKVTQFQGKHSYDIENVGIMDYEYVLFWCKPFNVKVGEGTFDN